MSEITLSLEHPSLGCGEIIARYDLSEIQKKAYEQGRVDGYSKAENDYFTQSQKDREDAYNCGYEKGKADATRWIPCEDELPEANDLYLVAWRFADSNRIIRFYGFLEFYEGEWEKTLTQAHGRDFIVDAWMKLPDMYDGGI